MRLHRSLAVLGPPRRFQLMLLLLSGVDRSVSQLAKAVRLSQSCTTRHLQALERAGLVKGLRDGKRVVFRPAPKDETARGVLASLLLQAEEMDGASTELAAEMEPAAPRPRAPRRAFTGPVTIAVDAPQPPGSLIVASRIRAAKAPGPAAASAVMLAAGRTRRSRAATRNVRQPAPNPDPPRAPAAAESPEPAAEVTRPRALEASHEPEIPRRRPGDVAFEPEFEQPFQPPPPRDEPESGNTSAPHEPPAPPSAGTRYSSDIEDFLL